MNQWLKMVGSQIQANQNWADQIQQFMMPGGVNLFWFLVWNAAIINCNKFFYTTVSEAKYDCAFSIDILGLLPCTNQSAIYSR